LNPEPRLPTASKPSPLRLSNSSTPALAKPARLFSVFTGGVECLIFFAFLLAALFSSLYYFLASSSAFFFFM